MDLGEPDFHTYKVIVNAVEEYGVWPDDRENPLGWQDVGFRGTQEECLAYVKKVWKDWQPPKKRIEENDQG